MINLDTVISKNNDVVLAELDGKVVMMSIENGQYYGLDEIGSAIWEMIGEPVTVNQIVSGLLTEYDVEQEQCENDVIKFLNRLFRKKLIDLK